MLKKDQFVILKGNNIVCITSVENNSIKFKGHNLSCSTLKEGEYANKNIFKINPTIREIEEKFSSMKYKNPEAKQKIELILLNLKTNPPTETKKVFIEEKRKKPKYKLMHVATQTF